MGPDIGAAGALIFFFSILVALILSGLVVFGYAAYSLLVVLVNTAAGNDEVRWPGDTFMETVWQFWYLLWLVAVWAVPVILITGSLHASGMLAAAILGVVLWLTFPLTLLSSLSASTRWVIYRPAMVGLFARHANLLLGFYIISGILGTACFALLYAGIQVSFLVLPLASFAAAVSWLIYGRLLGRVGHVVSWVSGKKRKKKARALQDGEVDGVILHDPWAFNQEPPARHAKLEAAPPPEPREKRRQQRKPVRQVVDPWAVPPSTEERPAAPRGKPPEEAEDPLGPVAGSYRLAAADPPWQRPPTELLPDHGMEGYAVAPVPAGAEPEKMQPELPQVSEFERRLAERPKAVPPPGHPLTAGVFSFPFYQTSVYALVSLTLGFLLESALFRALLATWPSFWD